MSELTPARDGEMGTGDSDVAVLMGVPAIDSGDSISLFCDIAMAF
jgi:hypothetical protein